jgi:hypothetical protein
VHDWAEFGSWPGFRANLRRFGRALLPGIPATLVALGVTALMIIDLSAVSRGVVPGGTVLTAATGLLILAVGGFAGLVVVAIGRRGGEGWIPSVRAAFQLAQGKPTTLVACAGITGLTILLSVMIMPILTPILAGYTVLALHAAVRRLGNPDF